MEELFKVKSSKLGVRGEKVKLRKDIKGGLAKGKNPFNPAPFFIP
jgi:hypothetical protein